MTSEAPTIVTVGLSDLARAVSTADHDLRVLDYADLDAFTDAVRRKEIPDPSKAVFILADNTTGSTITLEMILARFLPNGLKVVVCNVSAQAATWAQRFPGLKTLNGPYTVNRVLAAAAQSSGFPFVPVLDDITIAMHSVTEVPQKPAQRTSERPAGGPSGGWKSATDTPAAAQPQQSKPRQPQHRPAPQRQPASQRDNASGRESIRPVARVVTEPEPPSTAARKRPAVRRDDAWQPAPETTQPKGPQFFSNPESPVASTPPVAPKRPAKRIDPGLLPASEPAGQIGRTAKKRVQRVAAPRDVVAASGTHPRPSRSMTITIAAPKGGTGKSSVAINTAGFLGLRTNQSVAIVDLNIQQSDVGKYLKAYTQPTIIDIVANLPMITADNIRDYMAYSREGNFYAILGPSSVHQADPGILNSELYLHLVHILRETFDYIVLDTPVAEYYHDIVKNVAMREADQIVVVVAPNWTTIHDTRLYLDSVTQNPSGPRLPVSRVGWVLNQYREDIDCAEEDVRRAMAAYPYLGILPYTPEWQRANNRFELIVTQRFNDINAAFSAMMQQITGVNFGVVHKQERPGFLAGLLHRRRK